MEDSPRSVGRIVVTMAWAWAWTDRQYVQDTIGSSLILLTLTSAISGR